MRRCGRRFPPFRRDGPLPFFFYGTLVDRDLLARVLDGALESRNIRPAILEGFRRVGVVGRSYPIVLPRSGGRVDGILVYNLDLASARRLAIYEGNNYRLTAVCARDGDNRPIAAVAFLFAGGLRPNGKPWRLDRWQRRWKRQALRNADRLDFVLSRLRTG